MNMHCLQFDMSVGGILTEVKQQMKYKQQQISFKVNYRKLQGNLLDTCSCFVLVNCEGGGGGRDTERARVRERSCWRSCLSGYKVSVVFKHLEGMFSENVNQQMDISELTFSLV